ncbi:MAG: glycerophosphodiester phosphodiesterase family protein [Proteobacteria bacterium]|nr:glycerophosphodiester phosphodiesterase family protein [Pseudomonadota bacterium]
MTQTPDWLRGRPIAHRGLHNPQAGIPENSLAAFAAAVADGYGVELDVQASADGQAMVFHDWSLVRMTGADGGIADHDAAALTGLRLQQSRQRIPTLSQVLTLIAGRAPVIVEIKNRSGPVGGTEEAALRELRNYGGPFAVTSFNPHSLAWFRERMPAWPRGQNVGSRHFSASMPFWRRLAMRYLLDLDQARPDFVVYDCLDLPFWAAARRRAAGKPLLAFTIRNRAEMRRLAPYVDNIIFEGFRC